MVVEEVMVVGSSSSDCSILILYCLVSCSINSTVLQ